MGEEGDERPDDEHDTGQISYSETTVEAEKSATEGICHESFCMDCF